MATTDDFWDTDEFNWTTLDWGTDDEGLDALALAQLEYERMPERGIKPEQFKHLP